MRHLGIAAVTAGFAAALAACGSSSSPGASSSGAGANATAATTPTAATVTIATGNVAGVGTVLVDANGHTLYHFTPEASGTIGCTAACATNWPPAVLPAGETVSPSGSLPGRFGTINRPDGSVQITYNSWPLYDFGGDTAAGQANGQGRLGKWFAVTPDLAPPAASPTM